MNRHASVRIIGSYLSPFVRKVLAVLHVKQIPYEIDPIVPFFGGERFSALSPLRRVPVLVDDRVTLADSSVICQYLEDRYPQPALYPADIVARARARWLEEFADTRIAAVFIWRLFDPLVIGPHVFGRRADAAAVQKTMQEDLPAVLDYLEGELPATGLLFGQLSIADLAVAVFFRNAAFARISFDEARWPRTLAFVERVLELPCLSVLKPFEDRLLRTRIAEHREVLAGLGAPLTAETIGSSVPRPGPVPRS